MPVNPIQFVQMIKNGYNPQQLMLSVLEQEMKGGHCLSVENSLRYSYC